MVPIIAEEGPDLQEEKPAPDNKITVRQYGGLLFWKVLWLGENFLLQPFDPLRREIARGINSLSFEIMTE